MLNSAVHFLLDFFGLRYIWQKVQPPKDASGEREPRTFFLWAVGIYISLFGLAAGRYEKVISRLEDRVRFVIGRTESQTWKGLAYEVPKLQNTRVPFQPTVTSPLSVFKSFLPDYNQTDKQSVLAMQVLIYNKKTDLAKTNLSQLILANESDLKKDTIKGKNFAVYSVRERSFSRSNFQETILEGADFEKVDFYSSNFSNAVLTNANLRNANLSACNFQHSILHRTDLSKANLLQANLTSAVLEESNMEKSILAGADLSEALEMSSARWTGAIYNSKAFNLRSILKDEEIKTFCNKHKLAADCFEFIRDHIATLFEVATKFPDNFKPEDHGMVDIQELVTSSS